jgi:hypothetical protein
MASTYYSHGIYRKSGSTIVDTRTAYSNLILVFVGLAICKSRGPLLKVINKKTSKLSQTPSPALE